jgi:hypothetical protein
MSRGASGFNMRHRMVLVTIFLAAAFAAFAQEPPPPPTTPPTTPPATTPPAATPPPSQAVEPPPVLSPAAGATYDRREPLPYINLYLPEGEADVRLRKLIKNVLFESQITYRFVNGDISTFLRYKYYARTYTYKLSVFDSIGFPSVGARSSQDFQRTRGGLFLMEFPRDYNHRYYWLIQDDRLTFGEITNVDNRKNNIYTKLGYQYGTQFDEHLNSIVGETRGRILPVLTAFRDIGPQKLSFAAAVTQATKVATGDYQYTKFEAEALRRFDLTPTSFIVTRAHFGAIPFRSTIAGREALPQLDRYSVPVYEMFNLGGREALRSISAQDEGTGTNEFHITNEYFVPVFRNRDYKTGVMHWNTLYAIGYLGAGNIGFQMTDLAHVKNYAADAGLGAEASVGVRDFDVLFSVLVAHTLRAPDDLGGTKVKVSIRTVR